MSKVTIAKDWYKANSSKRSDVMKSVQIHRFEKEEVTKSEDLPQLLTMEEAAKFLRVHEKTVRRWIRLKDIRSFKIKGRRFVTPEQLGEFLNKQYRKNG